MSNNLCSGRGCDIVYEGNGAADAKRCLFFFFPQHRVMCSGLLADTGVLAAVPASAGMGVHHSSEIQPR